MKKRFAPKKSVPGFFMFATIFVAITIPLVVIKLNGEESFDTRNKAYETGSPTLTNPCVIYLPKVNPNTLETGGSYTISVEAISSIKDIQAINIVDDSGNTLFEKSYNSLTNSIEENFTYSPSSTGANFIRGSLTKVTGDVACSGTSVNIISKNTAPEITSEEKNSDISVGDEFEYTITAEDIDKDIVNFSYSFTPRADWLKKVIIEDGSNGTVKIKLQGTPDKPASYLAHIFVHDGYGNHLSSMAWIINVNQSENDIPIVKIINPPDKLSINKGDEIYTQWLANDLNQIIKYQIYMSEDPSNSDTWKPINEDISYKVREYSINTSKLSSGTYRLIIRALDNQEPSGIGFALSPEITILGSGNDEEETSDNVILAKPQIINMTPNNSSEVENPTPVIRATLIAGTDAVIQEDSISFRMNDKEITEGTRLNKISDKEITFIYQPEEDLDPGIQKVYLGFIDSNDNSVEKEWTFTVLGTSTNDEDQDTITIFGIRINKKTALIIGAGILVVLLAILVPVIIYNMWSKNGKDYSEVVNKELPPKIPKSDGMYSLQNNINTQENNSIPVVNIENDEEKVRFSTPSLSDLENDQDIEEIKTKEETTKFEAKDETIPSTKMEEKNTWTPQVVETNVEKKDNKKILNNKSDEENKDIPPQIIPNLDIPSPETFKQSPNIETLPVEEKSLDEISKLYEEIQKVEDNEDTGNKQNSE